MKFRHRSERPEKAPSATAAAPVDVYAGLGPLEWFDPRAFEGDAETPQAVCDFVLMFAMIANDLKNTWMAGAAIFEAQDPKADWPDARPGQISGTIVHVIRLQGGILNELVTKVRDQEKLFDNETLRKVVKGLPPACQATWQTIHDVAANRESVGTLGRALGFVRDKVGFHYDLKALRKAYRARFLGGGELQPPFLSRGDTIASRRFYFADAVGEEAAYTSEEVALFKKSIANPKLFLADVIAALYWFVCGFVQARGFAWRQYSPAAR